MMLRDHADEKVRGAKVEVKTGRKWRADKAVDDAEARLRHADIFGTTTIGRMGLGCVTRSAWKTATEQQRCKLVQDEVCQVEEEQRQAKAVSLKKQGRWLHWE